MRQSAPTTPRKITSAIKRFIRTLGTGAEPRFLCYTQTSDKYRPGYCLNNCEAEHNKTGDRIDFGWVIWEDRKQVFIEAEFHAVIKRQNELLDITPRVDGEEKILFVPDTNRFAERIDINTWKTWANQKSKNGSVFEQTRPIEIEAIASNIIA